MHDAQLITSFDIAALERGGSQPVLSPHQVPEFDPENPPSRNYVSIVRPDCAPLSRVTRHTGRMHIGYARVSTTDQTTDLQTDALNRAGCERIFTEVASGARADRVELAKALEFLRRGDTLVVWKLDRLARSMSQLIATVTDLDNRGIGFQSLTENIDTLTSTGRFTFHVFAALAAFERDLIRERTAEGLRAAAARGRRGGRPKALTDEQKRMALAMLKDDTLTALQIAEQLGIGRSTLYRHIPEARRAAQDAR